MYRTHNCGQIRMEQVGEEVTLSGWVQKSRDLGGMTFVDMRDRYGLTQVVFNMETRSDLCQEARKLGREYVIQVSGKVAERSNKNPQMPTGDIEILAESLKILNKSEVPPFTIENNTDGGDDIRMKYRYLDLRRPEVRKNLMLRSEMSIEIRKYMSEQGFLEVETPVLIKSTPEGARDFVVPSRMNPGEFYALPQSPQTFKQLLMVAGFDKYFQIVKCFRDEDLRADRQPEFTQIDCEMSFVDRDEILEAFEGLTKHLFRSIKNVEMEGQFPKMDYSEAMSRFGNDKPDVRFGMEISEMTSLVQGKGFQVFDALEYVGAICAEGCAGYSRKQLDALTDWVKRPQIGMKGLVYVKYNEDGSVKSSVDKFFDEAALKQWLGMFRAKPGDLLFLLAGERNLTLKALSELRLEMGSRLELRDPNVFKPLWVVDFPLLDWDEETGRFHAMHHPFTSPYEEDIELFNTDPGKVRAKAYDLVINGVEIGGGSIRIHDEALQSKMFDNGAPPHGGIAFGFDRLVALFAGIESIRDVIAFPKNNSGRDVMIDTPSTISGEQLDELFLKVKL